MNSTEACIALNMLPTVGPVRLRKLLEVFKDPPRILAAKRSELRVVEGIGNEVADQISNWESIVDLAAELKRVREFGASVITKELPSYPKSLREIHAPPLMQVAKLHRAPRAPIVTVYTKSDLVTPST